MRQTSVICEFVPEDRSSAVGGCSYIGFINMVSELELLTHSRKLLSKTVPVCKKGNYNLSYLPMSMCEVPGYIDHPGVGLH